MSSSQESHSSLPSSDDASGSVVNFITIDGDDSEHAVPLNWEPKRLKFKGVPHAYWIVANTRVCAAFCTTQLKVYRLIIWLAHDCRLRMRLHSSGPFNPRSFRRRGKNIMRHYSSKMALRMFCASIVVSHFPIPTETQTKAHRQ